MLVIPFFDYLDVCADKRLHDLKKFINLFQFAAVAIPLSVKRKKMG